MIMNAKLLLGRFISEVGPGVLTIGLLTRTALGLCSHHPVECYVTIPDISLSIYRGGTHPWGTGATRYILSAALSTSI